DEVLSRSLNIPMVHLLNRYGLAKFHSDLTDYGFSTLKQHPSHYGLSLILGGAEVNLQELNQTYVQLAQKLSNEEITDVEYCKKSSHKKVKWKLSKASIYETFEAMTEVKRPDEENHWKVYSSSQKIAWKTGTSFGFRDAWSVGITPKYVVSIWIGNADGEGRPGLTGFQAAAPLLFDIFKQLPSDSKWFKRPTLEMVNIPICAESGQRATEYCISKKKTYLPENCILAEKCNYHKVIHLNEKGDMQVNSMCMNPLKMRHESRFLLPTFIAKFYQKSHPNYQPPPPFDPNCVDVHENNSFYISYPKRNQTIFLPIDLKGSRRKIILEAIHQQTEGILYWHLDGEYLGTTRQIHQLPLIPEPGKHSLMIVEENGSRRTVCFTVLDHVEN
ncbi:MAG: penicillin-binding protein 1C, partial [Crocinitomicaceae bacterium]|nr:penicillin-binding protein 1C [Crocinitomicaceae bacterium]